jgi:hypothetical protein
MSDEQQSGQAQTPDRHTLGNAITEYPNALTRKLPKYLADPGVQIAYGLYPKELLTTQATKSVKGSGGVWACHAVLAYFGAHYNAKQGTTNVSNQAIADDLGLEPATVSKCKTVLVLVGLLAPTGKKTEFGVPKYTFPWYENQLKAPIGVLNSTDIQHITAQVQHTTPQAKPKPKLTTPDPFLDRWELLIADLPNEMKSGLNYKQAKPVFMQCLTNGWDKYPEQLKSAVMHEIEPGHTEPGKLVNVLKDIALTKPTKPIVKCGYDNCNGNLHESVESGLPYPCPNKSPNF